MMCGTWLVMEKGAARSATSASSFSPHGVRVGRTKFENLKRPGPVSPGVTEDAQETEPTHPQQAGDCQEEPAACPVLKPEAKAELLLADASG